MRIILLSIVLLVAQPVIAVDNEKESAVYAEKGSVFKGGFYTIWSKFKSMVPKNEKKVKTAVTTAGIRGAETTNSILEPYWKDDRTDDKDFIQQLDEFSQAQQMAENGDLLGGSKAFSSFIKKHPNSDLSVNAQFGEALTMAAMGETSKSNALFKVFIKENSAHPLAADAKAVMNEFK